MNIYRSASNKIALSTFPSLEGGYILLRFTRGTSNVYAISANITSEEFPMVAQITEIGSGTPTPADGEVLLDAGSWTCYAYEQVSATNYNPDCSQRFLEEIPINVFGASATVLNQTPAACPGGSGGAVDSVNGQTGTVVLDAADVDAVDYFTLTCGEFLQGQQFRKAGTSNGKDYYEDPADADNLVAWVPSEWRILVGGVLKYTSADAVANPALVTTWSNASGGALPLPVLSDLYSGTVQDVVEELAVKLPTPKVYAFIANQTGTAAPVMTVLTNTLGGTVVWTYDGEGVYTGTLAGAFPANKTVILTPNQGTFQDIQNGVGRSLSRTGDDSILITTEDAGVANGVLVNTPFKLEVYP